MAPTAQLPDTHGGPAVLSEPAVPAAFVLKDDVETADDIKLADLEIEGLIGQPAVRLPEMFGRAGDWANVVEPLSVGGVEPSRVLLGLIDRDTIPRLQRRLGMIESVWADGLGVITPDHVAIEGQTGAGRRSKNEYLTHRLHKYKAKFFPRLARSLLNHTTPTAGRALDPFTGSGTLNVEAAIMGVDSAGLDIDPLSVYIADSKVAGLHLSTRHFASVSNALRQLSVNPLGQDTLFSSAQGVEPYVLPEFIGRKVQQGRAGIEAEVSGLRAAIESLEASPGRELLALALSHALATKISLRWMGTGDNRFSLSVGKRPVARIFWSHLQRLAEAFDQRDELTRAGLIDRAALGAAVMEQGDIRALPYDNEAFSGIVTSPPYLPASSGRETYLRSRAPSLMALRLMTETEILAREKQMVGSILPSAGATNRLVVPDDIVDLVEWMRPQRARAPKAEPTLCYFKDLGLSLREIGRVLAPGGKLAMVVSAEHVFYDMLSREIVRRVDMPAMVQQLIDEPRNEINLQVDRIVKIELPKMDYAARPASKGTYAEAIIIAKRS